MNAAPYRVSAREPIAEIIPPPSRRVLLHPLKLAIAFGGGCLALILVWAISAPIIFGTTSNSNDVRFVPMIESGQDALQIGIVVSLLVLIGVFVWSVVPRWRGLGLWKKLLYMLGIVAVHVAFIALAEAGAFMARGGLHLFEPRHVVSSLGPGGFLGGKSAHIYKDSFLTCHYDVYVSGVLSPTMKREMSLDRRDCSEPTPTVKWNSDGSVRLVDELGKTLEPQQSPSLGSIFTGGGC
jgi:hypothetical protein